MSILNIKKSLTKESNKKHAKILQRFFKTGKGEYGEGDVFLGIKVPVVRKIAKKNLDISYEELQELINSPFHEERLTALIILVLKYPGVDDNEKEFIYNFYLKNTKAINNWDLVDLSAPNIIGNHLLKKNKEILFRLARSKNMWERRISIMATFRFIKEDLYNTTLKISYLLLNDEHDLIHKAVGWMLREIGKRNLAAEELYLKPVYTQMPRTMLRYAIEKFPEKKRKAYLSGTI